MKKILVLGPGCARCNDLELLVRKLVTDMGVQAVVSKETSPMALVEHKVMKTPGVVIDGKVVWSGGMPTVDQIKSWF
ncbi:thioredoxin family protein [Pelagibaculum spongiae]|uniref:Thioredoxin family protein n=1 Tax=Pelagibaculum spongiae TaxID=2080658 RepID=A0A2V1GWB9_9GAMM|nr:thioredoxin family protein [Pelagibaculum spongiae]PVZ70310.1 thioredoxin family protein [Pelagibaculum spongiae]